MEFATHEMGKFQIILFAAIMFRTCLVTAFQFNYLGASNNYYCSTLQNKPKSIKISPLRVLDGISVICCLQNNPSTAKERSKRERMKVSWEVIASAVLTISASFSGLSTATDVDRGALIFQNSCSKCHAGISSHIAPDPEKPCKFSRSIPII